MFSFSEELKWYEPGLETIEESLSGNREKDLVELMQLLLKAKVDPLSEKREEAEDEGTQLSIEDALLIPESSRSEDLA